MSMGTVAKSNWNKLNRQTRNVALGGSQAYMDFMPQAMQTLGFGQQQDTELQEMIYQSLLSSMQGGKLPEGLQSLLGDYTNLANERVARQGGMGGTAEAQMMGELMGKANELKWANINQLLGAQQTQGNLAAQKAQTNMGKVGAMTNLFGQMPGQIQGLLGAQQKYFNTRDYEHARSLGKMQQGDIGSQLLGQGLGIGGNLLGMWGMGKMFPNMFGGQTGRSYSSTQLLS